MRSYIEFKVYLNSQFVEGDEKRRAFQDMCSVLQDVLSDEAGSYSELDEDVTFEVKINESS